MRYLSLREILELHDKIIEVSGGEGEFEIYEPLNPQ